MTIETLRTVFGWMTIINGVILVLCTIALVTCKGIALKLHQKVLSIPATDLNKGYFQFLANYKLLLIMFNLVPYIALRIMLASQ